MHLISSFQAPIKQREFPSWLKNEGYMMHGDIAAAIAGNGEWKLYVNLSVFLMGIPQLDLSISCYN